MYTSKKIRLLEKLAQEPMPQEPMPQEAMPPEAPPAQMAQSAEDMPGGDPEGAADKLEMLMETLNSAGPDAVKFDMGNSAAGTRLRKKALEAAKQLKSLRSEVQGVKNSRKEEKAQIIMQAMAEQAAAAQEQQRMEKAQSQAPADKLFDPGAKQQEQPQQGMPMAPQEGMQPKMAMMGNSPLAQKMMQGSELPGYSKGGPVKKDGYLTDKKGKPYARVHKGEKVVPAEKKAAVEKIAEEGLGFADTQRAYMRAMSSGAPSQSGLVLSKDNLKRRMKAQGKGYLAGGAAGALLGALLGGGRTIPRGVAALVGGSLGGALGAPLAGRKSDRDYMKSKGIDVSWHGMSSRNITPEARAKYFPEHMKLTDKTASTKLEKKASLIAALKALPGRAKTYLFGGPMKGGQMTFGGPQTTPGLLNKKLGDLTVGEKMLALGGGAAALTGGIRGTDAAIDAVRDPLQKKRALGKMLADNPSLMKEDQKDVGRIFSTLYSFNPKMAKDPLVSGSFMRRSLQFKDEGIQPQDVKTLAEIGKLQSDTKKKETLLQAMMGAGLGV